MKNKNFLVALSKLLKVDESVILEAAEKDGGDDSLIKSYTDKYNSYSLDELGTLIKNSNKQYLEKADFDINDVPKGLYSKIAAASIESKEKALSKEYNISEYKDFKDLFTKAVESKTGKGVDELSKQQIETLKQNILKVEQDKEEAILKLKNQFDSEFISRDFNSALSTLPLKAEKDVIENKRKLLAGAFNSEFKLARKNNLTVVLGKDDKPVTDKLGEPEKISNVLKSFAEGYGFEFEQADLGGRGASSSDHKTSLKGLTWQEVVNKQGIKPNTDEADKAYAQWQAENPK